MTNNYAIQCISYNSSKLSSFQQVSYSGYFLSIFQSIQIKFWIAHGSIRIIKNIKWIIKLIKPFKLVGYHEF